MKELKKDYIYLGGIVLVAALLRVYEFTKLIPPSINVDEYVISKLLDLIIIGLVFGITAKITKSRKAGLFAAALSTGIPLYNWTVAFELYHTLALFLYMLTISIFISVKDTEDWWFGLFVPLILAFIHIYSLFLVAAFILFIFFVKLEGLEFNRKEVYFIISSTILTFLVFLTFTLTPGVVLVLKQYINVGYFTLGAENFTLAKALAIAGTLPIYLGVIGVYHSIQKKSKNSLILLSTIAVFLGVMLFNVVQISLGLPYFILSLAVFSGFLYEKFVKVLGVSRFKDNRKLVTFLVFVGTLGVSIGHWLLNLSTL